MSTINTAPTVADISAVTARRFEIAAAAAQRLEADPDGNVRITPNDLGRELARAFSTEFPSLARALPTSTSSGDYARLLTESLTAPVLPSVERYPGGTEAFARAVADGLAIGLADVLADGLGETWRVASPTAGLLAAAARLLPAADRCRYSEEYLSEVRDLAQSGAGRLKQLLYALRVLLRAIPTSRALRAPQRRSAGT